jgi:hypothetical protein
MSRGPGIVQRRVIAAFQSAPTRHFTVEQLAQVVFLGAQIERKHAVSVRRALKKLQKLPGLDLQSCRAGKPRGHGWRYVVGLAE